MTKLTTSIAALAIAAALPASAAEPPASGSSLSTAYSALQRLIIQYTVLSSRSFVELTYDDIAIESGSGDAVVSGLQMRPDLDWDPEGACTIKVDTLRMSDAVSLETLNSAIVLGGVSVSPDCLPPPVAGTLSQLGYDGVTVDRAALDISYHLPSSSAELALSTSVAGAADVSLWADFDYLWFRIPMSDDDDNDPNSAESSDLPIIPVARLGGAELVIENHGLWQAIKPMVAQQMGGDLSGIPQLVGSVLVQQLSQGGARSLTPEETELVGELKAQLARFLEDQDSIVITARPAGGSVPLTSDMPMSPAMLVAALNPTISAVPAAYRQMIPPEELAAALAGNADPDAETRLRVGRALVTGEGAPRAPAMGRTLLAPLAEGWNAEAALLTARADRATGDLKSAYALALRAMAGGAEKATSIADSLEAELPLAAVLNAQADAADAWPGAGQATTKTEELLAAGDISGIAEHARAAAAGHGQPRNYAAAYYWATLAAAAGDRGATSLRDRLNTRFAGQPGWTEAVAAAQKKALTTWTSGLAATIAARTK